jgi:hypothetical protein
MPGTVRRTASQTGTIPVTATEAGLRHAVPVDRCAGYLSERAVLRAYCTWAMTWLAPAPSFDQRLSTSVQYAIRCGDRQRFDKTHASQRRGYADEQAQRCLAHGAAHDQRCHSGAFGAERHANADLRCAPPRYTRSLRRGRSSPAGVPECRTALSGARAFSLL